MMKHLTLLSAFIILAVPAFAETPESRGEIGANAPAGKIYTNKKSAGKPRQMEIYFPPNHTPTKAKVPGMILFHAGSWGGGSLAQAK